MDRPGRLTRPALTTRSAPRTRSALRARSALVAAAVLAALISACAGGRPAAGPARSSAGSGAAVDLAAARARAGLAPCPAPAAVRAPAAALPDLTLPCLGGGPDVPLARLTGVPLVLNAWASWCVPCRAELPAFQRAAEAARPGTIRILGVDTEDAPASALEFAAARGVHLASLVDATGALRTGQHVAGLPFTLFVRADGSVASVHVGPLTYQDLVAEADRQLGVRLG